MKTNKKTKKMTQKKLELYKWEISDIIANAISAFFKNFIKVLIIAAIVGLFVGWLFEFKLNTFVLWTIVAFEVIHLLRCILAAFLLIKEMKKKIEAMKPEHVESRIIAKNAVKRLDEAFKNMGL